MDFADLLLGRLWGYWPELAGALVAGFLLGLEREQRDKPAGLRTLLLISFGSALYMVLGEVIPLVTATPEGVVQPDPTRIPSQVIIGIGFLGGGTIIQSRGSVHGLTTAAVIWVAAAIGLASGLGFPLFAIACSLATVLLLRAMEPVRRFVASRGPRQQLDLLVADDCLTLRLVEQLVADQEGEWSSEVLERRDGRLRVRIAYRVAGSSPLQLLDNLRRTPGVEGLPVPHARAG
jgi:putative Mg2+ transporter-C (MgtC) family protein